MLGRRRSTQSQADKDLSEQVINLGTSTRPIITTVSLNKKGSVTSSPPRSSSSSSISAQVDVFSSETSLSPLRRSKRKREIVDDADYADVIEESETLPSPTSLPSTFPPSKLARSTTKSDSKPKPPFLRKLEEYTSKKAKSTVVRWSKDGTRLYIFDKEQMRKDLNELKWLAHGSWNAMHCQLSKHGFWPVRHSAYTEVEQELHTQGTGLTVYHNKDYVYDRNADYSYAESPDPTINFSVSITANTKQAEKLSSRSNVVTASIGERVRRAAASATAAIAAGFTAELSPPPPPLAALPLVFEMPEPAPQSDTDTTAHSLKQDHGSTEQVEAVEDSTALFPSLRSTRQTASGARSLADLPVLVKSRRSTKNLPRGEHHWAAKAKQERLLREAQAQTGNQAAAEPKTLSPSPMSFEDVAIPKSPPVQAVIADADPNTDLQIPALPDPPLAKSKKGSNLQHQRGEKHHETKATRARELLQAQAESAASGISAPAHPPLVQVGGDTTRRFSLRQTEDHSTFSSRYPRACRPTKTEMTDVAKHNEDTEEELYLLFEDAEEVEERPIKRRRTGKPATLKKETASVQPLERTKEELEVEQVKERLERESSRVTRATSSSATLISEDFTSPPRKQPHLRTPTSLSPAARTSNLPPVKESDDMDYIPSSPLTEVDEGTRLPLPLSSQLHSPSPTSLSPFFHAKAHSARAQDAPPSPLTDIDDLDDDQDGDGAMNFDEAGKTAKLEEIERHDEIFARKLFGHPEVAEPARDVTPAQCEEIVDEDETAEKNSTLVEGAVQLDMKVAPARDATPAEEGVVDISTPTVLTATEKQSTPSLTSPAEDRQHESPGPANPEPASAQLSRRGADILHPFDEDEIMMEELFFINKPSCLDSTRAAFPLGRERSSHNLCHFSESTADSTGILTPERKTLGRVSDVSQIFGSQGLYNFGSPKTGQSTLLLDLQVEIPEIETPDGEQEEQIPEAACWSLQEELPSLSQESPSAYFVTPEGSPSAETVLPPYTASSSNIVASSGDGEPGLYGPFCNWVDSKLLSYEDSSIYLEFNVEGAAYTMENGERLLSEFSGVDVPRPQSDRPVVDARVEDQGYPDDYSAMLENLVDSLPKDTAEKQKGRESRSCSEDTVDDDSMRLGACSVTVLVSPRDLSKKTCDPFLFEAHPGPLLDSSKVRKQARLHRRQSIADMRLVELEKRRSIDDGTLPPSPPQYDYESVRPVTPGPSLQTMISELEAAEPRVIRKVSLTEQAEREEARNSASTSKTSTFTSPILVRAGAPSAAKPTKAAAARAKALAELDKNSQQRKSRSVPPMGEKRQYTKKRSVPQDNAGDSEYKGTARTIFKTPRLTTSLNPPEETKEDTVRARPTYVSSRSRPSMRNKRILNAVSKAGR